MNAPSSKADGDPVSLSHNIIESDIEMLKGSPTGRDYLVHPLNAGR